MSERPSGLEASTTGRGEPIDGRGYSLAAQCLPSTGLPSSNARDASVDEIPSTSASDLPTLLDGSIGAGRRSLSLGTREPSAASNRPSLVETSIGDAHEPIGSHGNLLAEQRYCGPYGDRHSSHDCLGSTLTWLTEPAAARSTLAIDRAINSRLRWSASDERDNSLEPVGVPMPTVRRSNRPSPAETSARDARESVGNRVDSLAVQRVCADIDGASPPRVSLGLPG
ncbi:hypothetical protein F3087_35460 [Nocardia colli]|uniref:Uncharacterized protein n=1 Tax=Nocardia colli TaxID=2545717 RepID=A0A5N0E8U0_9NOCA|nr:hypothetical protein [Nocardia colli]KAA8883971.1 hypothetical protein F3087_35460 [Nocardia colli]